MHLLCGPVSDAAAHWEPSDRVDEGASEGRADRVSALEREVAALRAELDALRGS